MSGKRIDADLGFLSLALNEISAPGMPVCPEHRSADGLRLRALLASPSRDPSEDIPMAQDAQDGCVRTPKPIDHYQRLAWLVELIHCSRPSGELQLARSVSLQIPADLLKDSTLEVRALEKSLDFELRIGDANARMWACDKLVELVAVLASRINSPFTIRIVDTTSSCVVAAAGKERDDHLWHRASFCEN